MVHLAHLFLLQNAAVHTGGQLSTKEKNDSHDTTWSTNLHSHKLKKGCLSSFKYWGRNYMHLQTTDSRRRIGTTYYSIILLHVISKSICNAVNLENHFRLATVS